MDFEQLKQELAAIRRAIEMFANRLAQLEDAGDSEVMELTSLYPTFDSLVEKGRTIKARSHLRHGVNAHGDPQLYRVVSDHVPVAIYPPDVDPTHYTPIGIGASGKPKWTQPLGSTDAYQVGDEADFNGVIYVNTQPNNSYAPNVWGWVLKETPEEPPEEPGTEYNSNGTVKWSEWVDWLGDHSKLYNTGDGVTHNGVRRVSNYDGNGTPPNDVGWWRDAE
ncbi:MAG: hypothetical protein ACOYJ1_01000 [Peptococcales bacterium]|jgi:hypothetical protein